MKRLHSYADELGEARAQAVLPCFDFHAHLGRRRERIATRDADGCGIPCSGPAPPVLLLIMSVCAGGSWAE